MAKRLSFRARRNIVRKRLSDWLWPWPNTRRHINTVWVSLDINGTALFAEEDNCRRHAALRDSEVREIRFGELIPFRRFDGPGVIDYCEHQALLLPEGTFLARLGGAS